MKKSDNNNKKSKRLQLLGEIKEIRWSTLIERRMKGDLIETVKIFNGISYLWDTFVMSPGTGNLLPSQISKIKFTNQSDFLIFCW